MTPTTSAIVNSNVFWTSVTLARMAVPSRVTAAWLRSRFATSAGLAELSAAEDAPSLAASYWGFRAGEVLNATVWTDRLGPAVQSLALPNGTS